MVRHAPIHRRSGHSDIAICCGRNVLGSSPSTSVVPLSNQVNHFESQTIQRIQNVFGRTLRLFNTAKAKGVAIFFISTRREDQRDATVNNLKAAGYDGWADLALKQPDDKSSSQEFKTARRKEIEDAGFTIIANVGDQYSDPRGGHAERVFKVPNPFYFIP